MASKKKIDYSALRARLSGGSLTKQDVALLDEWIVSASDLEKLVSASKEKVRGKSVIAKLPFGVDLVK